MYDLKKIIIMGTYGLDDRQGLETVVMQTEGMKIISLLYINDTGSISDKKDLVKELKNELYADQYNEDDLKIKVKQAINGEDCMCKIASYVEKHWDENTLVYFYDANENCYNYLDKLLMNSNVDIYLEDYCDIFTHKKDMENNIYTIMENNNLKTENLIKISENARKTALENSDSKAAERYLAEILKR